MTPTQHRTIQHLTAKARLLRKRDELLGPESTWDPLDTLVEVALGAPLTTANGLGGVDTELGTRVLDHDMRLSAAKELANFLYPKLKAIEHSGPEGGDIPIRHQLVDDIAELARRAKLKPATQKE